MNAGDEYRLSNIIVKDGDTILAACNDAEKAVEIRLRGIDAPEKDQRNGVQSTSYLRYLLSDRRADTVMLHVVEPSDRHERVSGFIRRCDAGGEWHNVNVEMVAAGLAYCYREYGGDAPEFELAEHCAKVDRVGVWETGRYGQEKPWDKRHKKGPVSRTTNWLGRCIGNLFDGDEEE